MMKLMLGLLIVFTLLFNAQAADRTWTGATDSDWHTDSNWSPSGVPLAGESVLVNSGTVLLTNDTAELSDFSITNATMVCSNWYTTIYATNVTIQNDGVISLPLPFSDTEMSNQVHVVCTDFTLNAGGKIDVTGRGYRWENGPGRGYGSSPAWGGGGGHGGRGGDSGNGAAGGVTNGLANAPTKPGSGGGRENGGAGGGAVRIEAVSTVTIEGTITANGTNGVSYTGGGSGGSVYVECGTFGGGGSISASGGNGGTSGGGGGGGRIAVVYDATAPIAHVKFSARAGATTSLYDPIFLGWRQPGMGTLYLSNTNLLSEALDDRFDYVRLVIPNFSSWSVNNLVVSNGVVVLGETAFSLEVANDLKVKNGGVLSVGGQGLSGILNLASSGTGTNANIAVNGDVILDGGTLLLGGFRQASRPVLNVGGSMALTNGGALYLYSGETNATAAHGAEVTIAGPLSIGSSSWIYPVSHDTNGGSAMLTAAAATVVSGGGIDASGLGFADGRGPGHGTNPGRGGGGGYGGVGGDPKTGLGGGGIYGSTNAPLAAGSGGGKAGGGYGGGLVRMDIADSLTLNGEIMANGANGAPYTGGGSGGGVFLMCDSLSGTGEITAKGGNGYNEGGGGGGGRIAVAINLSASDRSNLVAGVAIAGLNVTENNPPGYGGQLSVTNGLGGGGGFPGNPGSAFFLSITPIGYRNLNIEGSPDRYGSPANLPYGQHLAVAEDGSEITNSVSSPADEAAGERWACLGWNLKDAAGGFVDSGTTTQAVFTITTNLVLTWEWTNQWQLAVTSGSANGSVNSEAVIGWYTNGVTVMGITATPSNGYEFSGWTGDVPPGSETSNPITVTMDQARTIQAEFGSVAGETKVWNGLGPWTSSTNWSPAGMPSANDQAIVASGTVLLANARTVKSLTITNATLTFTNWTTSLTASNVVIENNGKITLPSAFTDMGMSNRVHIVCTDLTVAFGGLIDVSGGGYRWENGTGRGYGSSPAWGGGGGHGGRGGNSHNYGAGGVTNGLAKAPTNPGSGGGRMNGGAGGGAVRLDVSGALTLNGKIMADGANGDPYTGGGSGGGVFLMCDSLSGTGEMTAKGGTGGTGGGGGGGGRIAIWQGVPEDRVQGILDGTDMKRVLIVETSDDFSGEVFVDGGGGGGDSGTDGSIVFLSIDPSGGTVFLLR